MAGLRTLFRRLRTLLWTALTLVIVLAAVLVGVGKLLMPYSQQYQPQLEAWLSKEFQQPVVLDSFTGEWKAFGPRISLEGVNLMGDGEGDGDIAIQHAALDIKPLNLILPNRPLYSFQIIGADLSLIRTEDGRYELSGLGVSGRNTDDSEGSGLSNLARVGEVRLEDSSLGFDDPSRGIKLQLTGIRARLQMNGNQLSTELDAALSDSYRNQVLGDLKATALITLDDDQRLSQASWHVKTGELMIEELVRQLPQHHLVPHSGWLNAEIWGDWEKGGAQLMRGVIDVRESVLSQEPRVLALDHLNTRFRWEFRDRKSWRIDLSDLTIDQGGGRWSTPRMSIERNIPGNLGLWVSSDFVDLAFPLEMTSRIMSNYSTRWPRSVPRRARGQVNEFDLVLDHRWKLYSLNGRLSNVDAWEWGEGRYPDVAGVTGEMDMLAGEGEIHFSGDGIRLDWPRNFRAQAIVDIPECLMEITWGIRWTIDARQCRIQHEDFELSGRARFAKTEGKPVMDINMLVQRADMSSLDDYWPSSVMSENVINWLQRGIVSGTAQSGRYQMRGDLDDWPFRDHSGLMVATTQISDATLDYAPGWPSATGINAQATFRNTAMTMSGSVADMGGVPVASMDAHVADFKNAVLELDYQTRAPLPDLVSFMSATPVMTDTELDLSQFRFEGQALTAGRLVTPLGQRDVETTIEGILDLEGNRFTELRSDLVIDELKGRLEYNRDGMAGEGIQSMFQGFEARLGLAADWDADEVFSASINGAFPMAAVLPETLLESEPMLTRIHGASDWDMRLSVARSSADQPRESWLVMRSEMEGVNVDLPAPLNKSADARWPVEVRFPVDAASRILDIQIQDRAQLLFELGDGLGDARRATIHFGTAEAVLPESEALTIDGSMEQFDADEWMALVVERFSQPRAEGALQFEQASLQAAELLFMNRAFDDVDLGLAFADSVLTGTVTSDAIEGDLRYSQSSDGSHSLSAQLERFYLPEPLDEGMIMDADPSTLPELHFFARDFRYQGIELGETRIEAFPVMNGLRIESLESVTPQLNFQARGDWTQDEEGARSDFDILMTSESVGSLFNMMDVSSVLEGGQTILRYDAWWPGTPAQFALARLNGEMVINVVDGKILDADVGAGRVVGLLSIAALPRRLALDFRDVFGSGYNFDQAAGTITLQNGMATTDDLVLESTAAIMSITGSSNLVDKEFDYRMVVRPGVSKTLPAIGAVIGGPGGAAAGLALQGLLRNSLGDATEAVYTIKGPWTSPAVEPVEPVRAPASPPSQGNENNDR